MYNNVKNKFFYLIDEYLNLKNKCLKLEIKILLNLKLIKN